MAKIYLKCLKKRNYLIDFVKTANLGSISPIPRIDWKKTTRSWNQKHPYDTMTKAVFKATYYRALKRSKNVAT